MARAILSSLPSLFSVTAVLMAFAAATPGHAGMQKDLSDCTAADRPTSAAACSRVMASGRLPNKQFYIGHYNRGWSYFNANDYDKALADFDKSIKYHSTYADTYFSRALVQHERGEREKSLADLDRYLELKGDDWEGYFKRGLVFRRRGEPDRAFSELQKAEARNPTEQTVIVARALVLSDLGEQGPARREAEKALAANPDDASAHYARGLVSFRENKIDAAAADAEKALALKDDFPAAHTLMGRIAEARGDKAQAETRYRRALALKAKSVDARSAHDEARDRLKALTGEGGADVVASTAQAVQPARVEQPAAQPSDCRKFIPAVQVTVSVACDE